jgi:filamentous hemagglutinin family protein
VIAAVLVLVTAVTRAGPEGAQVIHGSAQFNQTGNYTAIQASDKAIINYSQFNIARPETVQFIQPNADASVLNRILSANPTTIDGTLLANGRVFFVNPAGVIFGESAQVVAEGAEGLAEAAEQASFGDELVEGVGDLKEVVEDLDGMVMGAVGVLEGVSAVLLGVEAFVLNLPA